MKSMVRFAVLVVSLAAAGCVSNDEAVQVSAAAPAEASAMFGELHAAIPASKANGQVFEY